MATPTFDDANVVVLTGALSADPRRRDLPSGDHLVEFDVTTRGPTGVHSAPVAWFEPGAGADRLSAAARVVVLGVVRRRFFRVGGTTQSRTEVVAQRVADATKPAAVRRLLADAARLLAA